MSRPLSLPPRASYTQLSSSQNCGFQYYLKYLLGLERVGKSQGLFRGTLLHEAVDKYLFTGRESHHVAHQVVDDLTQEALNSGDSLDAALINATNEEAHTVLDHYLPWADLNDDFDLWLPEGAEQCETSGEIEIPLPDGTTYPFFFKIDVLIKRGGVLGMMENKFRKNLDSNGLEHDLQILLYQAAWNHLHPENRINFVLYNIVAAKPRKKDGVIAVREYYQRGAAEERMGLRNAAAMIMLNKLRLEQGIWPMNPTKDCNWRCDFVGPCMAVRAGAPLSEQIDGANFRLKEYKPHARKKSVSDEDSSDDE